jgi:PTH2 family peptidyl-tRNA hydrolase
MSHKQVIVIRKDLNMRKGKIAAQAAHASLGAILSQCKFQDDKCTMVMDDRSREWLTGMFKKICVYVESESELLELYQKAKDAGLISSLIQDQGHTEFHGVKTYTAIAIGPDYNEKIDAITGQLPLY